MIGTNALNPQSAGLRYIAELLGLNLNPLVARGAAGLLRPTSSLGPAFAGTNLLGSVGIDPTIGFLADQSFGNAGIPFTDALLGTEMVGPNTPLSPREAQILFPSGNIPPSFQSGSLLGGALGLYGVAGGAQDIANSDLPVPYRALQGAQTGLGFVNAFNNLKVPVTQLAQMIGRLPSTLASGVGNLGAGVGNALSSLPGALANALPSLATAGLSLGAGFGGTKAAEAVFGRSTEQSLGSGAGAGAGALAGTVLFPGIGTVLGALLGAFGGGGLGSAFHSTPTTGTRYRDALDQIFESAGLPQADESLYTIAPEQLASYTPEARAGAETLGAYLGSFAPKFKNSPAHYALQAESVLLNNYGEQSSDFARQIFQQYGITSPSIFWADVVGRAPNMDDFAAQQLWQSANVVFGMQPGAYDPQAIMAQAQAERGQQQQASQQTAAQQVQDQLQRIISTGRWGV